MRCIICTISVFEKLIKEGYCGECFKRKKVYETFCLADKIMLKFEKKIVKQKILTYVAVLVILGLIGNIQFELLKLYFSKRIYDEYK
jgi:hypothetical protein